MELWSLSRASLGKLVTISVTNGTFHSGFVARIELFILSNAQFPLYLSCIANFKVFTTDFVYTTNADASVNTQKSGSPSAHSMSNNRTT